MRPRVIPADDAKTPEWVPIYRLASMRPRVIPADDDLSQIVYCSALSRFNEAAGYPRG